MGIQRLGEGSKSDDPNKTGQYGVGFNSVYHLTDVPTFLSDGKKLCVFDPHCFYVPDATEAEPGQFIPPHIFRRGPLHSFQICLVLILYMLIT